MLKRFSIVVLVLFVSLFYTCDQYNLPLVDTVAPGIVTGVTANPGDGMVTLNWINPSDRDLLKIEVTYTGGENPIIVMDRSESVIIDGLDNGVVYVINLVAVDESENRSDKVSVSITPIAVEPENPEEDIITPIVDKTAPDTVDDLIAQVGDGVITLSWINPSDDDFSMVTIEYAGLEEPIEVINGDEFIIISDLINGESYTFVVKTYDEVGNSAGSESVITQPLAPEPEFINGINMVTWYAENYVPTGNEMIQDFSSVNWNEVYCDSVSDINSAFSNALPGDKIMIAPGTYTDTFKLSRGGSMESPIWIVAEDVNDWPILDGEDFNNGTVLGIDGGDSDISYIYVQHIKVTNARLGIAMDRADYVTIDNVEVYNIGQEAIHVRDGSEYNIIKNSFVHDTGLYNAKYGEGIYIGSDNGKWISNGGNYDPACDYTQVLNNIIGPNVTAEHIDIKEGSSYAYIMGNSFNAAGMKDILNGGLSFIDFKGNNAVCAYNTGDQNGNELFENAFEVNDKWEGWGCYNYIHNNTVTFNEEFYNPNKVDVTVEDLPLGSSGNPNLVTTTDDIDRDQWVVECNNQSSADGEPEGNVVYNNIRIEQDADRMYNSSSRISEEELTHDEIISLGL